MGFPGVIYCKLYGLFRNIGTYSFSRRFRLHYFQNVRYHDLDLLNGEWSDIERHFALINGSIDHRPRTFEHIELRASVRTVRRLFIRPEGYKSGNLIDAGDYIG